MCDDVIFGLLLLLLLKLSFQCRGKIPSTKMYYWSNNCPFRTRLLSLQTGSKPFLFMFALVSSLCLSTYCSLWKKYKTFVYVTYYVFMRISWICIHICLFGPVKIQEMVPTSWTKYVCWRSFLKFRLSRLCIVRIFYIWERRIRKIQWNSQWIYNPMGNPVPLSFTIW